MLKCLPYRCLAFCCKASGSLQQGNYSIIHGSDTPQLAAFYKNAEQSEDKANTPQLAVFYKNAEQSEDKANTPQLAAFYKNAEQSEVQANPPRLAAGD